MYETIYSDKYEQGLDITEIAKRLRREIRTKVKAGELPKCKYSVRISRYSMGQSLSVTITETPFPVHNRRYLELELEHRILFASRKHCVALCESLEKTQRWTQEAIDLIRLLEVLADQWNYDGSETQTDYFHVNYSSHVDYDAHDEWVEMTEAIKRSS